MILENENWSLGYDTMLEESRPGNGRDEQRSILVLCNADVDAMASARILTYLFRSDAIPYQLLPCTSYQDLRDTLRQLQDQMEQFSAIVLLNFGASYNLTKLYMPQQQQQRGDVHHQQEQQQQQRPLVPETLKIFVLDCRRPVHLANVYEESAVVVFMNESKETIDNFPSDGDDLSGIDDDDETDSDSDSHDEDDEQPEESDDEDEHQANFDNVEGVALAPEKKTRDDDDDHDDDTDYDGEDEEDRDGRKDVEGDKDDESISGERSPKRQKIDEFKDQADRGEATAEDLPSSQEPSPPEDEDQPPVPPRPLSQRELCRDRALRLIRYYDQGSYFAAPASFMAYRMAEQLRQGEEGDLLWLACVGVTDAYLHARVDRYGFGECGHVLKNSCMKLYPDTRVDRALNSFDAEHLNGSSNNNDAFGGGPKTKIKFSDNGRILAQDDYRFFLLRHSNLLDSMLYSDYVYAKLQMNTKKGQQRFMEMLAKMGLPLDECRQPFRFMKTSLRSRLKTEFENHADVSVKENRSLGCHLDVILD